MQEKLSWRVRGVLTLAAVLLVQDLAMTQTNSWVAESAIDAVPLDLEVTPNGKVAVVRGNNGTTPTQGSDARLSLWRTETGAQILPNLTATVGRGNLLLNGAGEPVFSDAVAVTNDRIVAIGSGAEVVTIGEDTTYVDILGLDYSNPVPLATVLATHSFTNVGTPNQTYRMGYAHDVAITPDGGWAIVVQSNWVHFFELGGGNIVESVQIGSLLACASIYSRNSVELTNSRAIVTTGRFFGNFKAETEVFVFDLQHDPPELRLHDVLTHPSSEDRDFGPHDLAITPDGLRAVVTATGFVALYDLAGYTRLGLYQDNLDTRRWNLTGATPAVADLWDSVEVSDTRAVVLSNRLTPQLTADGWGILVFDISSGALTKLSWDAKAQDGDNNAWDVAMAADKQMATIKTTKHDIALLNLDTPATSTFLKVGPAGNLSNIPSSSGAPGINDSTVLLAPYGNDPVRRWAAFDGLSGPNQVQVRLYDLGASSWNIGDPSVVIIGKSESTPTFPYLNTADLALTLSGTGVIFRLTAPFDDDAQQGGVDWLRFAVDPLMEVTPSWGGNGVCVGMDSLRVARNKAVSISRDPDPFVNAGWIHIVTAH